MPKASPVTTMLGAALLALALVGAALLAATGRPLLDLPPGAQVAVIGGIELEAIDATPEPDVLDHAGQRRLYERQDALSAALGRQSVSVRLADGSVIEAKPRPRGLADLPFAFWFQIGVGLVTLLIGAWVLALRPKDWGARMFALTGVCVPVFAFAAAVYSTREIALPGATFRTLAAINQLGACSFGIGLVGLFLTYPRQLVGPAWLGAMAAAYLALAVAGVMEWLPYGTLAMIVMSQMALALALGVVQWFRARREPRDRAGLRWFLAVTLVGCSLFILTSVAPPALGLAEAGLVPQGYAFGFFAVMHVGLALGVLRYRTFELDRWAWRLWLWLGGALLVVAVDLALLGWLGSRPWASLTVALLVAGFVWFPLRQWVLERIAGRRPARTEAHVEAAMAVAFAAPAEREGRWDAMLRAAFAPLESAPAATDLAAPAPSEDGLSLTIPPAAGCGARRLRYAQGGRRLFTPEDARVAAALARTASVALESRESHERGAAVERERIARDVHDNIGAQLMSALHAERPERKDELIRDSLADLRTIVSDGEEEGARDVAELVADLRAEAAERLAAQGIALDWPLGDALGGHASPRLAAALRAVVREAVSNVLKHAAPTLVSVRLGNRDGALELELTDDGAGLGPAREGGAGLRNMRERATALGGSVALASSGAGQGTRLTAVLPLAA